MVNILLSMIDIYYSSRVEEGLDSINENNIIKGGEQVDYLLLPLEPPDLLLLPQDDSCGQHRHQGQRVPGHQSVEEQELLLHREEVHEAEEEPGESEV